MEGLIGGLIAAVLTQGGLLWYKMGKLEQSVKDLRKDVNGAVNKNSGGKR